jgi:hypothetical protein
MIGESICISRRPSSEGWCSLKRRPRRTDVALKYLRAGPRCGRLSRNALGKVFRLTSQITLPDQRMLCCSIPVLPSSSIRSTGSRFSSTVRKQMASVFNNGMNKIVSCINTQRCQRKRKQPSVAGVTRHLVNISIQSLLR